jgi:hypothetical protein
MLDVVCYCSLHSCLFTFVALARTFASKSWYTLVIYCADNTRYHIIQRIKPIVLLLNKRFSSEYLKPLWSETVLLRIQPKQSLCTSPEHLARFEHTIADRKYQRK